ncbi:MAG: hypothetical protein SGPRY_006710 [Prymnesium sp.]
MDDITILCKGGGECLCCEEQACCAAGEESKGIGCPAKKEGDICRIACPCCAYALIKPRVLCANGGSCLCCWSAASFPFSEEYVDKLVCALYCLQLAPEVGCCKPPPYSKTLDKPKSGAPPQASEMAR